MMENGPIDDQFETDLASIVEADEPRTEDDYVFRCAWCRGFRSESDRERWDNGGSALSHGICEGCASDAPTL